MVASANWWWCVTVFLQLCGAFIDYGDEAVNFSDVTDDEAAATVYAEERRLFALPNVAITVFQDTDIIKGTIGGRLQWTPPSSSTPYWNELTGYKLYLTDALGTLAGRTYIGTVVGSATAYIDIPDGTSLNNHTYFSVHSTSPFGESPGGDRFWICDIDHTDTLHIVNAVTTPAPWGVVELSFYIHATCQGPAMTWALSGSSGDLTGHPHGAAFDGSISTGWVANYSTCTQGHCSIGLVGVCQAEEVRCVKIKQCLTGSISSGACTLATGRSTGLALMVKGKLAHTWKALTPVDISNLYIEETLITPGRRRRAAYGTYSDLDVVLARTTNPGFSR